MSARDELIAGLVEHACCFSEEDAERLVDAFAHELAEQVRTNLPADPGGKYLTGSMDEAAELIDPETTDDP